MRPNEALPVITFNDKLKIYINGEQVSIFHIDNAHTDGDALLYFVDSNVLHTGDTYFSNRYPYIDLILVEELMDMLQLLMPVLC